MIAPRACLLLAEGSRSHHLEFRHLSDRFREKQTLQQFIKIWLPTQVCVPTAKPQILPTLPEVKADSLRWSDFLVSGLRTLTNRYNRIVILATLAQTSPHVFNALLMQRTGLGLVVADGRKSLKLERLPLSSHRSLHLQWFRISSR